MVSGGAGGCSSDARGSERVKVGCKPVGGGNETE